MRSHHKRQVNPASVIPVPTGVAGVGTGAITINTVGAPNTGLVIDTSATAGGPRESAPALAPGSTVIVTTGVSSPTAVSGTEPSETPETDHGHTKEELSVGKVVGVCVAAGIVALVVISLAVCWYKKNMAKMARQAQRKPARRVPVRQSGTEKWEDLEEGKPESNKGASVPVVTTQAPSMKQVPAAQPALTEAQTATYTPQLAETLVTTPTTSQGFLDRINAGSPLSWGVEDGAPKGSMHIGSVPNTPALTSHTDAHKWESAEVLHVNDPFDDKYGSNPFFGAGVPPKKSASIKGKRSEDVKPKEVEEEIPRKSSESDKSLKNDRAMANLMAALELTPDQVKERVRVGEEEDDEDVANKFPLPPA